MYRASPSSEMCFAQDTRRLNGVRKGIGELIVEEFRMYQYDQRLIDDKPNDGWQ